MYLPLLLAAAIQSAYACSPERRSLATGRAVRSAEDQLAMQLAAPPSFALCALQSLGGNRSISRPRVFCVSGGKTGRKGGGSAGRVSAGRARALLGAPAGAGWRTWRTARPTDRTGLGGARRARRSPSLMQLARAERTRGRPRATNMRACSGADCTRYRRPCALTVRE